MSFKSLFPKMLSYLTNFDPYSTPYSYYIPYPTEETESESQIIGKKDTEI